MSDIYSSETAPPAQLEKRRRYELLRAQMELERASFIPHWRDLAENVKPRRSRFFTSDTNRGGSRNQKIIDSTPVQALKILQSGMVGGISSPSRKWFDLKTPYPKLNELSSVKLWLSQVSMDMADVLAQSNIYNSLAILYGDIALFATGALYIEEDFDKVFRSYVFPVGSYMIANDDKLQSRVFCRVFRMTVRQLVMKFGQMKSSDPSTNPAARDPKKLKSDQKSSQGKPAVEWNNFSQTVRSLWENGNHEAWIDVVHMILPNEEYDPRKMESKFKKYTSCYYEMGSASTSASNYLTNSSDQEKYLRESGYDYFPVLVVRWEVTGEDVYGTDCPGMASLGDIHQLHTQEKRGSQAIEKKVHPPMVGPTELKNSKASILPGDITYVNEREGQKGFRAAHNIDLSIAELKESQVELRQRIRDAFFVNLFLLFAEDDQKQPRTAEETRQKAQERMIALGPVLEQLNQDLFDPFFDIVFDMMLKQGRIAPPPDEMQGVPLKIVYLSIVAQAQKLLGLAGVERFSQFMGQLFETTQNPDIWDNVDLDKLSEVYADLTSIPAGIERAADEVAKIRQQKNAAKQQAAQLSQTEQAAGAARNLAAAKTDGPNALTELLARAKAGQMVPQGPPAPTQ